MTIFLGRVQPGDNELDNIGLEEKKDIVCSTKGSRIVVFKNTPLSGWGRGINKEEIWPLGHRYKLKGKYESSC